jgi:hypothetical protein
MNYCTVVPFRRRRDSYGKIVIKIRANSPLRGVFFSIFYLFFIMMLGEGDLEGKKRKRGVDTGNGRKKKRVVEASPYELTHPSRQYLVQYKARDLL